MDFRNKKSYYLLIPIILILASSFIPIDGSNRFLNLIVLPILLSIFFSLLTNPNYRISEQSFNWFFKLFPKDLYHNLKYIQIKKGKNKKILNIITGIIIGGFLGFIILALLMSADDYFNAFIGHIIPLFHFDIDNIILFIIYFIVLFSVFINIILNKNTKMDTTVKKNLDGTIIITILSIVNFVFILFLLSEISRVTVNFLQLPAEYTYSSYAREGFFQLLAITMINFGIVMYLLYKTDLIKNNKVVKILLMLLIGFSILLIFNSYYRMFLYINRYGFTILRLQVLLFLTMEMILFLYFIIKVKSESEKKDAIFHFVIMLSFYILNLYLCTKPFIAFLNDIV